MWFIRMFTVLPNKKAKALGLKHKCNIYGDLINKLNCRSIWVDKKGNEYRVERLVD
jgi:hypothetical protein